MLDGNEDLMLVFQVVAIHIKFASKIYLMIFQDDDIICCFILVY